MILKKSKIINELKSISGDKPFIWIWGQDLFKCLNSEIKLGRKILAEKIKYYKAKGKNIAENRLKENPFEVIFMKNEAYKKQKEFRIFNFRMNLFMIDKTIVCRDCGSEFIFSVGEQEFYKEKGFENEPTRCMSCRRAKKQQNNRR